MDLCEFLCNKRAQTGLACAVFDIYDLVFTSKLRTFEQVSFTHLCNDVVLLITVFHGIREHSICSTFFVQLVPHLHLLINSEELSKHRFTTVPLFESLIGFVDQALESLSWYCGNLLFSLFFFLILRLCHLIFLSEEVNAFRKEGLRLNSADL